MATEGAIVKTEPLSPKCESVDTETNEAIMGVSHPEFICIKPEPVEDSEVEQPVENNNPHNDLLVEIKIEEIADDDDDYKSDLYSNNSETELPSFDVTTCKRSSNGQYQCPVCKKWLSKKGNLQRHLLVHDKEKLTCTHCGKLCPTIELLKKHVATEHTKPYECDECHKVFRSSSNLHQHMRSHIKPYLCELCDKRFSTMANLIKHRGKSRCKQLVVKPLYCEICDKTFKRPYLYKSHQVMHTTERPFVCEICKMTFKQNSALVRHMQLHNNDKPFSCDICGKRFTSKGLLKPHMRSHTGEKPFTCPVCQRSFTHKHNMQTHSVRHNIVRHLICEVCHKEFPRESRLKYHMRKHMPDNRPFKCEHCHKSYSCRQNIMRHYSKKHPTKTFVIQETDASIATIMWETVIKKKLEEKKDYIIPETDIPSDEDVQVSPVKCEYD